MKLLPVNFFPASMNNLITLCLVCRELYNMAYPKLVILPADLNRFIEFEVQDYQEREEAAKRGVKQQRALPEVYTYMFQIPSSLESFSDISIGNP